MKMDLVVFLQCNGSVLNQDTSKGGSVAAKGDTARILNYGAVTDTDSGGTAAVQRKTYECRTEYHTMIHSQTYLIPRAYLYQPYINLLSYLFWP